MAEDKVIVQGKGAEDTTKALKNITKTLEKNNKSLVDSLAATEAAIEVSKSRRKVIEGLIDVEGDIKIKEKDNLTTAGAVGDQVKGAGMSIVQGAESFVTDTFGGPIGGLINALSTGFLTRWLSNRKEEKAKQKQLEEKQNEEKKLEDKRISALADTLMQDEEMAKKGKEALETEIRAKLLKDENEELETQKNAELKRSLAFMKGEDASSEDAEGNGGEVVKSEEPVTAAEDGGVTEVVTTGGGGLEKTNEILLEMKEHLQFMTDNMEDAESRRERLRALKGKKAGGEVDVKKEEDGGFSFLGLIGTIIGAITGALMGAVAGLTLGFLNMWKNIFKFIGGKLAKMFPNVTKMLGDIFGKGGKVSKFFTSMKTFFTQNKAFKTLSDLIDTAKGAITKALKPVKTALTTLKTGFTTFFTKIKSWIKLITGPIDTVKGLLGMGKSTGTGMSKFGKYFKKFFGIFKGFFAKLFLPLQVIISLVEGFFEAKDAVDKSEGMMATFFNSIIGIFGGILDGLSFGMLDLVKDGISLIAVFLGFEKVEKFLDSFSFSAMFNEFLDDIYAWFNLLFSDPVAALTNLFSSYFGAILSVVDFIVDMLKKPFVWIMNLFGWDDAAAATESFSLSGTVMAAWDKVVAWVTGLFAWGKKAGATEEGGWSLMTFIDGVIKKVKEWVSGLFSWASTTEEGDSWVVTTVKSVIKTAKEWFGSMFQFDSKSGLLKTVLNIMLWLPNLLTKAVTGITAWFAGLLGFKKESKEIAAAGKEFNFGDLIMKAVKAIGKWFGDMFDKITNFDFAKFARGIMPDFLADMIFGKGESKIEKSAETKKAETAAQGGEAEKAFEKPDTEGMFAAILNPFRTYVKDLLADTTGIPEWVENIVLSAIPGGEVTGESARGGIIKNRAARGAIVTKPAYLPASGTVVGEHPTWSGKGAQAGGIPDRTGKGEAIIPLDGQRGGSILADALAPSVTGAVLNQMQMERVGMDTAVASAAPTIVDSSTNTQVFNETNIRNPSVDSPHVFGESTDKLIRMVG